MLPIPLRRSDFDLDSSGVAGFFGGDETVSAMSTINLYGGRRWLGWYNSPGSYEIAKKYGQLAQSRFWDGLFPGTNTDPAIMFGLDGKTGPEYVGVHSGTRIARTGHPAHLFAQECRDLPATRLSGRQTTPRSITVATLTAVPGQTMVPKLPGHHSSMLASIPIACSVGAIIACGLVADWFSFSLILLGTVTSGLSAYVLGSAEFTFTHPTPIRDSPMGDGYMKTEDGLIILLGAEAAVNTVTRGRFSLRYPGAPEYRQIGLVSMLLTAQFLLQLLLIPQGSLFGQIMFLGTLGVSWIFTCYLSSLDKEKIQRDVLMRNVLARPLLRKYELGTMTAMVVFALLYLRPPDAASVIGDMIPNNTSVWRAWKESVCSKLAADNEFTFEEEDVGCIVDEEQKTLLRGLYADAEDAYKSYQSCRLAKAHGAVGQKERCNEVTYHDVVCP